MFVKEMGFDSFEIDGAVLVEQLAEVRQAMAETGLKVLTVCNGYQGCIGDIGEADRQQAIKEISQIEGQGIVVPAAWGISPKQVAEGKTRTKEEDWEVLSTSLKQLNDVVKETQTFIWQIINAINQVQAV